MTSEHVVLALSIIHRLTSLRQGIFILVCL
jgi:hypothetical protein